MDNISSVTNGTCTGCFACVAVCPTEAIKIQCENDGFYFPLVGSNQCIGCGKCQHVCSAFLEESLTNSIKEYYLFQAGDKDALKRSASGGAFYAIAKYILDLGGYVCGCIFDHALNPITIVTNKHEDIIKMQGSKYVQSYIPKETYHEIDILIKKGKIVLFSGTPCQNAAIKKWFGNIDNLYLVDLICHGVGSPGLFQEYLQDLQNNYFGEDIINVSFRSKADKNYPDNFHIRVESKNRVYDKDELKDRYFAAFAASRILRESCYSCQYSSKQRVSDISIGDYLSTTDIPDGLKRNLGLNLVCINSEKGTAIIKGISNRNRVYKIANEPYKKNLIRPESRPADRDLLALLGIGGVWKKVLRRKPIDAIKSILSSDKRRLLKSYLKKLKGLLVLNE